MNFIRVIGVIMIAFMFLSLLIVVTIRKKQENQGSILLRILTNYIQMIAAAISFNIKFPDAIFDIFGPFNSIGSSSDTFLSFDCFMEDTEMKLFAPSTEIFKVFLGGLLPIALFIIYCIIWGMLYLISKPKFGNIIRHIVVSAICIVFLLHPTITKSTFGLFQCLQVDDDEYRVKSDMDIG